MVNRIESLIEDIKANCKWYFGHEVQVITFYKPVIYWCAVVVPAGSTMESAIHGCVDNAIHLFAHSSSTYHALYEVQDQLQRRIGKSFCMDEENERVILDNCHVPCGCLPPVPLPMIAEQQSKLLDLDTRLQRVEKNMSVTLEPIEPSDVGSNNGDVISSSSKSVSDVPLAAEIWPTLQRIERTLQSIEQRTDRGTVKNAADKSLANSGDITAVPPTADGRSTEPDTTPDSQNHPTADGQSAEPDSTTHSQHHPSADDRSTEPDSTANSQHHPTGQAPDSGLSRLTRGSPDILGTAEHDAEIPGFEPANGPHSPIPTQHYDPDTYWNDSDNGTVMTPSVTTTVRSDTPQTGPDEAAVLNRDFLREEINRALAGAMVSLAGLLGTGGI